MCHLVGKSADDKKNRNYMYQLMNDLKTTLKKVNAEDVLIKNSSTYALDMKKVECDYSRYMKTGKPDFRGEYMRQYSWAEVTCAQLINNEKQGV